MSGFQFRQFYIRDENCAMKVGTDSVLLACSVNVNSEPANILDIGAGSGILSLICCQRFLNAQVVSVEIDKNAYIDMVFNIENSIFSERIYPVLENIFCYKPEKKFDLIISNPPYFSDSLLPENEAKSIARHEVNFTISEMAKKIGQILSKNGSFWMIYPANRLKELVFEFGKNDLFLNSVLNIQNTQSQPIKRVVVSFSRISQKTIQQSDLIIRNEEGYSKDFRILTSKIYLDKVFI